MMAAVERPGALGMLAIEEDAAWREYLDAIRDQPEVRYEEFEPRAWARLGRTLNLIQSKRVAIEREAGR